jgi:rod shape-determining protein MreC
VTENRTLLLRTALIWLLLELLAATQVRSASGVPIVWEWLRAVAEPAVWTARHLGELTTDLVFGLRNTQRLLAENQQLRTQLQESSARIQLLEEDRTALRQATSMLQMVTGFEASSVAGRCIYRNLRIGQMEVRIGPSTVIPADTPVVSAGGLVGRVVHGRRGSCWVELLTHPAAAVAVQTPDGSVQGLVTGAGPSSLSVDYVPRTAGLLRGGILVTSGADGIYPPGIPVAEVTRIRESDASFLEVAAMPLVDVATVRAVLLLPLWTRQDNGVEQR